jgi:hypothetical protein
MFTRFPKARVVVGCVKLILLALEGLPVAYKVSGSQLLI